MRRLSTIFPSDEVVVSVSWALAVTSIASVTSPTAMTMSTWVRCCT